jgi:mono/diheme cytochrome c family protein
MILAHAVLVGIPISAEVQSRPALIKLYRRLCLECHDSDGRGEVGRDLFPKIPDFTNAGWQDSRRDAELSRSILEGKGKSMPRMRDKLGSVDVMQVVAFVRAFRGGKQVVDDQPDEPTAPERSSRAEDSPSLRRQSVELPALPQRDQSNRAGNRLYQRFCARCHGADGRGTGMRENLPAIPDFTLDAWQERRSDAQLVVSVLLGKGTGMPPFRDKVNRDQARDLVAFVRAFAPSQMRPAGTPSDPFEARFQQLEQEFENLRKQSRALSSSTPPAGRSTPPGSAQPSSNDDQP